MGGEIPEPQELLAWFLHSFLVSLPVSEGPGLSQTLSPLLLPPRGIVGILGRTRPFSDGGPSSKGKGQPFLEPASATVRFCPLTS